MDLNIYQQIFKQLSLAKKVLIALPETLTADALSAGLALQLFLQKMEKDAEVLSSGSVPLNLSFLPGLEEIKREILGGNSLAVILDTSVNQLEELSYQTHQNQTHIFLKAKTGNFAPEDVSFSTEKFPVDAIIILEADSLEDLGELFEKNANLFYEAPKINISNKASNQYFGAINLVDISSSSVSEVVASLFEKFERQLVDEDIATCLLTGIVAKTNSFQRVDTTPSAFVRASELIALGGRHSEIVRHVYKTKPLTVLKLWGRALARLKQDESLSAAYAVISQSDLEKSGAGLSDLPLVLSELFAVISEQKFVGLLVQSKEGPVNLLGVLHPASLTDKFKDFFTCIKFKQSDSVGVRFFQAQLPGLILAEAEVKLLEALGNL